MNVDTKEKVFAVVTSFDSQFNYIKLMKAVNYLKDEKVAFYATNQDLTFPGSVPGNFLEGFWDKLLWKLIFGGGYLNLLFSVIQK